MVNPIYVYKESQINLEGLYLHDGLKEGVIQTINIGIEKLLSE